MKKRMLAILLTLCMVLAVLPVSVVAYSARTTAPSKSSSYYYSSANPFYTAGWVGQCTWYAYGRAYEILGSKPKVSTQSADKWYSYNQSNGYYKYGTTPKIGAIACYFKNGNTHVAVVEEIKNGVAYVSEFNNGSDKTFHYRAVTSWGASNMPNGYIYLTESSPSTPSTYTAQVTGTNGQYLAINQTAASGTQIGRIPPGGLCTVTPSKNSGNWLWVTYNGVSGYSYSKYLTEYTGSNGWVKKGESWYYYKNGKAVTGWVAVDGCWYYMNSAGVMQTGWLKDNGKQYYLGSNGIMKTGWQEIDGVKYYFESSGELAPCAGGHSYGNWTTAKAATCTEQGTQTRKCSKCGETETKSIAALGHKWNSAFTIDKAATAVQAGEKSIHCSVCDERKDITQIPAIGSSQPFLDVPEGAYYYQPILWATSQGIGPETDGHYFYPENPCSRAETVLCLWQASGSPEPDMSTSPFVDVPARNNAYYKAVLWALENGITTGVDDTHFAPDATVTRGQFATFLLRCYGGYIQATGATRFSDVPWDAYYYEAVYWAVQHGITNGTGNGMFSPNATCTRGQVITFLYRARNES